MRVMTRSLASLRRVGFALAFLGLIGSGFAVWGMFATPTRAQDDQSALAGLISRLLSTPTTRVSIGGVQGALSSNAVITNITISDDDGVWLALDRAELSWSRTALFVGRLQVNALNLGRLEYMRPAQTPPAEQAAVDSAPLFPELPVEVRVDEFTLGELVLGAPVLGVEARFSASGAARIGDPSEGLTLTFAAERLDSPGEVSIDMSYAPGSNRLSVDFGYDEPAGGIAARLLELPGLPPVSLTLAGDDPLDDFTATLDFRAGETIGAEGLARVARVEAAYALDLDLSARLEGLMPPAAAPIFRGETRLSGAARVGDDSAIALDDLHLTTSLASLVVSGALSPERILDLRVTGRALPGPDGVTRADEITIGALTADIAVSGPLAAPRLNGEITAAAVEAPDGAFDDLALRIASEPLGGGAEAERFSIAIDGRMSGVTLADAALSRAIGDSIEIAARGEIDLDGVANLSQARILTPTFAGNLTGRVGAALLDATLSAMIADLAPLSGLAGSPLRGSAELDLRLLGDPSVSRVVAQVGARLRDFGSGSDRLDGLLGPDVDLRGGATRIPAGFAFDDLRISGRNLAATLNGRADETSAAIDLTLSVPDLTALDPRISAGRLDGDVRLSNTLAAPDLAGELRVSGMRALDRPIPRLVIRLDARDVTGDLAATASLDGEVSGSPATGEARVARLPDGGYSLDALSLRVGSVVATGQLAVDAQGLGEGAIDLRAGDLDDLSPLLLTRLSGALDGRLVLSISEGAQNVRLVARGDGLAYEDIAIREFLADFTGSDIYRSPSFNGTVSAASLRIAGQDFAQARLVADGDASRTRFEANATAQGFSLAAAGELAPRAEGLDLTLASLSANRGSRRMFLEAPARIAIRDGEAVIDGFSLNADGGRIALSGRAGETLDLLVQVSALPLSVVEIFAPDLGLSGVAEGEVRLSGSADDPRGDYRITLTNVSTPQIRDAGIGSLSARGSGTLANRRASVDATLTAAAAELSVTGSVPLDASGELDLRAAGTLDLAAANVFLAADGRRLIGAADVAATIRGMTAAPRIDGTLAIRGAAFTDAELGFALTDVSGRIIAEGDALLIESLRGVTPGGGTLELGGGLRLDPGAGFPGDLRITGRRARLVSNDLATAVADLDLGLTGPLASAPLISGRIVLLTLDVTVPDRLPPTLQPLPGTRHVSPPPQAQARLAIREAVARERTRSAPFNARLDLAVIAANRVFVRGRGINAELGGELRLTGTSAAPFALGAFELRRGRLDLLGQRLDFTRGRLEFSGDLTPELDFVAETQTSDAVARIIVSGRASNPDFILSATPDLPQDEVLSRILFDRAAGGLSPAQALQLAQGVATLAGGGPGVFDEVRRALGVDSLDISVGAEGPAVGVSRYISDNVRIGVRAGARPEDTGLTVDIDLSRRLRLQSQIGADGSSSVGIGYEIEY
ncbi:MAG: hypothetical protein EA385_00755 [Salinarimonadaceae bacterium]|nr:MAG: hypothetical protein EA385_00755 [Salinarimonadaceae bacterium]